MELTAFFISVLSLFLGFYFYYLGKQGSDKIEKVANEIKLDTAQTNENIKGMLQDMWKRIDKYVEIIASDKYPVGSVGEKNKVNDNNKES